MKRLLAAAVLVAFLPTANAQDKGKSDFTHGAEFRVRDTFENNLSGSKDVKPQKHNGIEQRFKLGIGFKASEKFSMNATLLQHGEWGQGAGSNNRFNTTGVNDAGDEENFLTVNEAYGTWMVSEDFSAKFGRMNFGFGTGSVMGVNDWEQQPYAFEGLLLNYEAEFGRFHGFAFKQEDLYLNAAATDISKDSDPQANTYGLVFDLKTMPEWLKNVNAFVIQDVADVTTTQSGGNAMTYGVGAGFVFAMVDLKAEYVMQTGKVKFAGPPESSQDLQAGMMQLEVGFNLPLFMGSRFALGYHSDTGTKAGDTKIKTYQAGFYEQHENAGLMDIVGWGNLTDMWASWTMKPMDNSTVGLAYHMFSKTQKDGATMAGKYGDVLFASPLAQEAALGSEIDLWAEHNYGSGFSMTARLGSFMPGKALKTLDTINTVERKESIMQAMLEAKLTF